MADNYLEKKMEDYRRTQPVRKSSNKSQSDGWFRIRMPRLRVLMAGLIGETENSIIKLYVSSGCKVAFLHDDVRAGQMLAQSNGALFIPVSRIDSVAVAGALSIMNERWGGFDVMVYNETLPSSVLFDMPLPPRIIGLNRPVEHPDAVYLKFNPDDIAAVEAVTRLCVYLSVPSNSCIRNQTITV